jgi:hypothetical protein
MYFRTPGVQIEVTKVSQTAIEAIERLSGRVTAVYHTREGIQQLCHPDRSPIQRPFERPILEKDIEYYSLHANRGYLSSKELYETMFKPRGYIADRYTEMMMNQEAFKVEQQYEVVDFNERLDELKELKEFRSVR